MKFKSVFPLLLLVLLGFRPFAQEVEDDSFKALTIEATVTFENTPLQGVNIQLFEGNSPVLEDITKKNGKLKYALYSNKIYTLQLTKEGYYPKRISINTKVPDEYDNHESFSFEIGMIAMGGEKIEDEGLLEYPSALIGFHPKFDKFYYDTNYDRQLKADIRASSGDRKNEPAEKNEGEDE